MPHHHPGQCQRRLRVEHGAVRLLRHPGRGHLDEGLLPGPRGRLPDLPQRAEAHRLRRQAAEPGALLQGHLPGGLLLRPPRGGHSEVPQRLPGGHHLPLHALVHRDGRDGTRRRWRHLRRRTRGRRSGWSVQQRVRHLQHGGGVHRVSQLLRAVGHLRCVHEHRDDHRPRGLRHLPEERLQGRGGLRRRRPCPDREPRHGLRREQAALLLLQPRGHLQGAVEVLVPERMERGLRHLRLRDGPGREGLGRHRHGDARIDVRPPLLPHPGLQGSRHLHRRPGLAYPHRHHPGRHRLHRGGQSRPGAPAGRSRQRRLRDHLGPGAHDGRADRHRGGELIAWVTQQAGA